ncbi:MAG: FkbM family methyltransferase [Deltaproteobacteria bacterium]|nr:FkbM family methyltransferase [Deltaproteobacteria bacterium]MBN2674612.1 FkbM family methyltransferase [Deltaproteobacteria bacterium]
MGWIEKLQETIGRFDRPALYYKNFLTRPRDVYIFGAGENGRAVKSLLEDNHFHVLGFLDNDISKHSTLLDGIPVFSPRKIDLSSVSMIAIASTWGKEIAGQLRAIPGVEYFDFSFYFDELYHSHFELPLIENNIPTILDMWNHLADDQSRNVLAGLLKYRILLDSYFIHVSNYAQYNCPKLPPLQGGTVLDVGAWHGDTAIQFVRQFTQAEQIVSFEPSKTNFEKLRETVGAHGLDEKITPVNAGWGDKNEQVHFDVNFENTGRSNVSQSGQEVVQLIRLDEFKPLAGKKISMIKMDIEGAEFLALQGAKRTIVTQKPQLAISVYHHGEDLWRIWKFLHSIRSDYHFFLGHHSLSMFETVLYAF